jgi:opacity protein-like surface antigen
MTSKLKLMASVAIAAASLVGAQSASAGNYYVNVSGGANWLHDDSFYNTINASSTGFFFDNDPQIGFVLSAAVGTHLDNVLPDLRVEGEFAYRENDVQGSWTSYTWDGDDSGSLDYQHSTYSVMANAWYDFAVMGLNPYVGGGIGWAHSNVEGVYGGKSNELSDGEGGFAWQLGAGLTLDVLPNTKMNIGYRYFQGPDVTVHSPYSGNDVTGDVSTKGDSVVVGFTFGM